jgi:hypothetical protein
MEPKHSLLCSQKSDNGFYPSLMNPFHTFPTQFFKIYPNITPHLQLILPVIPSLQIFWPKFHMIFSSPMCATCSTHIALLDLTTLIKCEEYK